MRAHCPVRRLTAPVWLSTSMCLHISPRDSTEAHLSLMSACPRQLVLTSRGILSRFPNIYSLNANTNVRNTFSENIYTPGVFDLERQGGGVLWEIFGCVDLSVYAGGVSACHKWPSGAGGSRPRPCLNVHRRWRYWHRGCRVETLSVHV